MEATMKRDSNSTKQERCELVRRGVSGALSDATRAIMEWIIKQLSS